MTVPLMFNKLLINLPNRAIRARNANIVFESTCQCANEFHVPTCQCTNSAHQRLKVLCASKIDFLVAMEQNAERLDL